MVTNGRPAREAIALSAMASRLDLSRTGRVGRWVAVAVTACVLVAALVVGTGRTSAFAVERIDVAGTSPRDAVLVRRALQPLVGRSLTSVGAGDVIGRLHGLPVVSAATYDRSFPHTLEVFVRTERPIAVLRRGADAWLVSAHARVLRRLANVRALGSYPRIWLAAPALPRVGHVLTGAGRDGVTALVPIAGTQFLRRVRSVLVRQDDVSLRLRSGLELRLGMPTAVPLKLAIAQRIAPTLAGEPGALYLDLTAPDRPVAGLQNSQPAG